MGSAPLPPPPATGLSIQQPSPCTPPKKDLALPSLHISQHPTRAHGPGSVGLGLTCRS